MSEVRTYRAPTMQDALDLVREELGSDAVILHTREVAQRRLLPWGRAKTEVEITAGAGVNVRPQASVSKRAAAPAKTGLKASSAAGLSLEVMPPHLKKSLAVSPDVVQSPPPRRAAPRRSAAQAAIERLNSDGDELSLSTRTPARKPVPDRQVTPNRPRATAAGQAASLPKAGDSSAAFAAKLDSIQKMLESLGRVGHLGATEEIPSDLFHLYTDLIDADVEDELARELVFRLKRNGTSAHYQDPAVARSLLAGMVEAEIRVTDPIRPIPGRRKVVALVGSTGVGKTTTIAKLAANFRLRDGVKMGLVTVDTYRVAAVEQLRTYAEIIDLPMKVVTNPPEMRRALDELAGLDLVLIDTAGRSPSDDLQIQELKSLLTEAQVDEVHLVLSLTSSLKSLQATAQKFAAANATSLILTKLDEAPGTGTLLSIARKIQLPISYLTTGQDVPADIEPASKSRIARLVLGQEQLRVR